MQIWLSKKALVEKSKFLHEYFFTFLLHIQKSFHFFFVEFQEINIISYIQFGIVDGYTCPVRTVILQII